MDVELLAADFFFAGEDFVSPSSAFLGGALIAVSILFFRRR